VVSRCPEGSRPTRTADASEPWACVLSEEGDRNSATCPEGTRVITTMDTMDPFKCALAGVRLSSARGVCPPGHAPIPTSDPGKDYECEKAGSRFMSGPGCPKGTRPVPTPGGIAPFKCVTGQTQGGEPRVEPRFGTRRAAEPPTEASPPKPRGGVCPKGHKAVQVENPFEPVQCLPEEAPARKPPGPKDFQRYRIPGEVSFDIPRGWHLTDAWQDEVPSVLVMLDLGRDGRPVSLSVTRHEPGAPGFIDRETQVWREKEWQGAREEGRASVGGLSAVHLSVPGHSRSALAADGPAYYVLAYSAPEDLFSRYEVAYSRLLATFKVQRKPAPPPGK